MNHRPRSRMKSVRQRPKTPHAFFPGSGVLFLTSRMRPTITRAKMVSVAAVPDVEA